MASPFEIAQGIGNQFGRAQKMSDDRSSIANILSQAKGGAAPQDLIGEILKLSPDKQQQAMSAMQFMQKSQEDKISKDEQRKAGVNPYLPAGVQTKKYEYDQFENYRNSQNQQGLNKNQPNLNMPNENDSNEDLIAMSGHPSKFVSEPAKEQLKKNQHDEDLKQKERLQRVKFGQDIAKDVFKETDKIAAEIPQLENSLGLMIESIKNGDVSFWTPDNLAEVTGIEAFRTMEGAVFKTASKEFFLGSLRRAGARPNQWIEQEIQDMLTKVGRSKSANLGVARALQNELDINKARVRITQEISDEIDAGDGDYRSLASKVSKKLSEFATDSQKSLFNDLKALKSIESNKPQTFQKVAKGTPVSEYMVDALLMRFNNNPKKAREEAKKLGYSIE